MTQAGRSHRLTLTVKDAKGNPDPGFSGQIRVESPAIDTNLDGTPDPLTFDFPASPTGSLTIEAALVFTRSGPTTVAATSVADPNLTGVLSIEVGPGPAGRVDIVSGNAQVVAVGAESAPLRVRVSDAFGNATPGASVLFTVTAGAATFTSGDPKSATAVADADGIGASFTLLVPEAGLTAVEATIVDAAGVAPAIFHVSAASIAEMQPPEIAFITPAEYDVVNTVNVPVEIRIADPGASGGLAAGGVQVLLDAADVTSTLTANVMSESEIALTGQFAGMVMGSHLLQVIAIDLNQNRTERVIQFNVALSVVGPVATIEKVSGDGQSGDAGTGLPERFVVRVTDDLGQPVAGATVRFESKSGAKSPSSRRARSRRGAATLS
ncbi:MAG: hypothetical protein HYY93_02655 [Planctomycetes bacterium]|nr:hypothetical protein [Planctomycetota bacterium]